MAGGVRFERKIERIKGREDLTSAGRRLKSSFRASDSRLPRPFGSPTKIDGFYGVRAEIAVPISRDFAPSQ